MCQLMLFQICMDIRSMGLYIALRTRIIRRVWRIRLIERCRTRMYFRVIPETAKSMLKRFRVTTKRYKGDAYACLHISDK